MIRNMNDMNSPYSVSVIIPVHNTAPYLERCVESVRNQTLKDLEIIWLRINLKIILRCYVMNMQEGIQG